MSKVPIRRALVSVYDKTGLAGLARELAAAGVEIVSTGSTAAAITAAGVPVTRVEDVTGFPECLDGRVKTLHPGVHAGLLADVRQPAHRDQLSGLGISPFELLVSNLYPFEDTVASGAGPGECVEQIDIGGPAMVRAAAKNHASVTVITDPAAYGEVADAVAGGGFTIEQRRRFAALAFARTAAYDAAVASWFASVYAPDDTASETGWPDVITAQWTRRDVLRYGENPHQRAALYVQRAGGAAGGAPAAGETAAAGTTAGETAAAGTTAGETSGGETTAGGAAAGIAGAVQLHGKAMSYNNYVDAAAARRAAADFAEPCVAIIKHSNPCGIAIGKDLAQAHRKAHACDPDSAFGGVIAANGEVTEALAGQIAEIFTEVVIAPGFGARALEILAGKKNLRLLSCPLPPRPGGSPGGTPGGSPGGAPGGSPSGVPGRSRDGRAAVTEWRQLDGGLLVQSADLVDAPGDDPHRWTLVTGTPASAETLADLAFAWRACRSVKSNAILLAADGSCVGIGMGQVNRVDAARLAVARAGDRAAGAVAASDAFFPFPDGLEVLAAAGVRAVVQPGGSVRDELVTTAAQQAGITMYTTGVRHFFH